MQLEDLSKKLEEIIIYLDKITLRLERIEERQKRTTKMIEDVEAPVTGSFGSVDFVKDE
jgi:hypothetical protein